MATPFALPLPYVIIAVLDRRATPFGDGVTIPTSLHPIGPQDESSFNG
jgi:hypothetical protein